MQQLRVAPEVGIFVVVIVASGGGGGGFGFFVCLFFGWFV